MTVAYNDGHTHEFVTVPKRADSNELHDVCGHCGVTFRDHARGFGSNVAPVKRRGPALQRSSPNTGLSKSEAKARNGRVTQGG